MDTQTLTAPTAAKRKTKPVILLVDDEKSVVEGLRQQLNSHMGQDYLIEVMTSGEETMDYVYELMEQGRDIAVVISDQKMPGMPGNELLAKIHELLPDTLKVMLTGQAEREEVGDAVNQAGLYRFIAKPWDNTDMRLTIEEAAKKYLNEKQLKEQQEMLAALDKATQVISRTLELENLSRKLLTQLQQFSGATNVILAVNKNSKLFIEGKTDAEGNIQLKLNQPLENGGDPEALPLDVLRHVASYEQCEVWDDLSQAPAEVATDPYIHKHGIQSAMVVPVLTVGKLVGILYLEHSSTAGWFSPTRVNALQNLSSKIAIAIENAYMYSHLEEMVKQRTERLHDTMSELMAVNSHKDRIIEIVSHDIRSPLTGIADLAKKMQDPDYAGDQDKMLRYGQLISKSAGQVVNMVNDILDLAKLESGKVILNTTTVQLGDFLKRATEAMAAQVDAKGVNLSLDGQESIEIELDASKFQQAIHNLVSNAVKFTGKGGDVVVKYGSLNQDGHSFALIQVMDTGVGIPQDKLENLFQKFTKYQRKGTKGEKGTGLGLNIAKEIIEIHNGSIKVESDEGMGTTFTIQLPLLQPETVEG